MSKLGNAFIFRKNCLEADEILKNMELKTTDKNEIDEFNLDIEQINQKSSENDSKGAIQSITKNSCLMEIEFINDDILYEETEFIACDDVDEDEYIKEDKDIQFDADDKSIENENVILKYETQELIKSDSNTDCVQCSNCGLLFNCKRKFWHHMTTVHASNKSKQQQRKYVRVETFKCFECDKSYKTVTAYKQHMRVHDPNNPNR